MEFYVIGYVTIFFFLSAIMLGIVKLIVKWVVDLKIFGMINKIIPTKDAPRYDDIFAFNGRVFSIIGVKKDWGRDHIGWKISSNVFNKAFDALISKEYINGRVGDLRFYDFRGKMEGFLCKTSKDKPMIINNLFVVTPYRLQTVKLHSTNHVDYYLVTL